MSGVTETCAGILSAIVQGPLAQLGEGLGLRYEANVKQRGSPVSPGAGYGQKILDTLHRELSWSHHRLLEAVGRRKKRLEKNRYDPRTVTLELEGTEQWQVRRG
jgi:hypothetical protein